MYANPYIVKFVCSLLDIHNGTRIELVKTNPKFLETTLEMIGNSTLVDPTIDEP
jgi:hypothetical protein